MGLFDSLIFLPAKIGFDTAENEPSKFWPSSLAHPLLGHITARGRLLLLEEVRELRTLLQS